MFERLQNFVGSVPDLIMRDGLLIDGQRNRLSRDAYLARLGFYLTDRYQRDGKFLDGMPQQAPAYATVSRRPYHGGEELLLRYPSSYLSVNSAMVDEVASYAANKNGYLFLWRHHATLARPLVLCVHGFQMGDPKRATDMFRVAKLFQLGLDVALFIQPHHWKRSEHPGNPFRQTFINPQNVPLTIEALGQAVHDLRSSVLLLNELGYEKIALIGASLGGYVSALYATVDDSPDCIFVAVPSLRMDSTLTPRQMKLGFPIDEKIRRFTQQALRIAAPVTYRPKMKVNNLCVVYHQGDRIAEAAYTREWIEDWGITSVATLHGGHWAFFDRKARGRAWYAWLNRHGFI